MVQYGATLLQASSISPTLASAAIRMEAKHMAHIADFMVKKRSMVGLNNYIARELSPNSPHDAGSRSATPNGDEKETYVWRMHQPSESRKYQLFPAKDKLLSITAGRKSPDPETFLSSTMGQGEKDRSILGAGGRAKIKEPTLVRRRKVSVPELGPMTTVQEVAMDSPTIPGRPPLHERSISAPGNSWRQHVFGESMISCISGPALDENAEMGISDITLPVAGLANPESSQNTTPKQAPASPKQPLSPKSLAPLVIPSSSAPQPQRVIDQSSTARRSSIPPDVPPKSARMMEVSPYPRAAPFTPMSASSTAMSTSTAPTSVSNTPNSAPEGRSSPKPWIADPSPSLGALGHNRGQSEATQRQGHMLGHRRGESEASIMDRGRPKKRPDGSPLKSAPPRSTASTEEQKAFETLPHGYRATEASNLLPAAEIDILRKQAIGQASRFEVLSSKDVEALSRELRALDERCEYLRKTHRSLRSGRRNLHDRICTYLRSPRVARFSHESILKQEEALSELDASIDDWVSKLEVAENRRTRVRQKLLEHVAAALIVPRPASPSPSICPSTRSDKTIERNVNMAQVPSGENTPPRSPIKSQSPQRLAAPVQVDSPEMSRQSVESIRIYADSEVYALLADVEEEINRMGDQAQEVNLHEAATDAKVMLNAATFSPPPKNISGTVAL